MQRFRDYINNAEYFFEEAEKQGNPRLQEPLVIATILFSWIAIESFINSMMQDFAAVEGNYFSIHEKGFLLEKQVALEQSGQNAGIFSLTNKQSYNRLEDKILFLLAKVGSAAPSFKQSSLWSNFSSMKQQRDTITHPRTIGESKNTLKDAELAIQVAKDIISEISQEIWKKKVLW